MHNSFLLHSRIFLALCFQKPRMYITPFIKGSFLVSKSHRAHKLNACYFSGFKCTSHFRFHASFHKFLHQTLLTFVSVRSCWSFSFSKLSCVTRSLLHLIDSLHLLSNDSSFRIFSVTWSQLRIYPANGKRGTEEQDPDRYRCQENPNMATMLWTYDNGDLRLLLFLTVSSAYLVLDMIMEFYIPILILSCG